MVYRRNDDDTGGWHEPPYTEEEEMEFYRRTGGAKSLTIYRSQRPASADKPHPKEEKAGPKANSSSSRKSTDGLPTKR
jgi:hypothetical protein